VRQLITDAKKDTPNRMAVSCSEMSQPVSFQFAFIAWFCHGLAQSTYRQIEADRATPHRIKTLVAGPVGSLYFQR
jgi:hypothetical protein